MNCTCAAGPVITAAEHATAEATGMDPLYVHVFMDTWTEHATRVLAEQF
jgi:hypothetical protein